MEIVFSTKNDIELNLGQVTLFYFDDRVFPDSFLQQFLLFGSNGFNISIERNKGFQCFWQILLRFEKGIAFDKSSF